MRVQNIQFNQGYFSKKTVPETETSEVNFKGAFSTYALIRLAIAGRSATITGNKKIKYLKTLESCISKAGSNEYLDGIMALSKTPNSFYDYHHQGFTAWLDSWKKTNVEYVNKLRYNALRGLSKLEDTSHYVIQAKKEFLTSFLDNGHEISSLFFEEFRKLNDAHYGSFKQEIIDKCFYSKRYNREREDLDYDDLCPRDYSASCDSFNKKGHVSNASDMYEPNSDYVDRKGVFLEQLYNNLKLVSVLDKSKHRYFIESRRSTINQSKQKLEEYFARVDKKGYSYKIPNLLSDYNANIKNL